jgi:hypothetical protein
MVNVHPRRWAPFHLMTGLHLTAALAAAPQSRAAEPTAADKETARSHVANGQEQDDQKDYAGALKSFRAAHAIMGLPTTGVPLAKAQIELGLLVEAKDTLLEVGRYPKKASEPEAFGRARTEAAALAEKVAARIATLQLSFPNATPGAPAVVIVDGVEIPNEAVTAPRKVNPGKHTIIVRSDGHDLSTVEVVLADAETKVVPVTLRETGSAQPAAAPAPAPTPAATNEPAPAHDTGTTKTSPLVYIGFGVGGAGLVVGTITGLMAMSSASSAKNNCVGNDCYPEAQSDIDSAKTKGTISTIGFAVGIVGVGVGIYGLLSPSHVEASASASGSADSRRSVTVTPVVGPGSFALRGTF